MLPYVFIAITLFSFAIFFIAYRRNKSRLLCGYLFCLFLLCAGGSYLFLVLWSQIEWLQYTLVVIAFGVLMVLFFGVYVLVAALLLNARLMFKRERRSLANSLSLLFALLLIAFMVGSALISTSALPVWAFALWGGIIFVFFFYLFHIFIFLSSVLLCNLARPKKDKDFIVVLGALAPDGVVSPLLAKRVDKAIVFYLKQGKKRAPPRLVMSGGQGPDEDTSEAAAMRDYALARGVPDCDILLEDQAENTYQNMAFSKQLMEEPCGEKPFKAIFATSNYHLLRSGIMAHKAGLPIDGIGSKTAWYYLPTALLREYVAYFWMHKRRFIIIAVVLFVCGVLFGSLPDILAHLLKL